MLSMPAHPAVSAGGDGTEPAPPIPSDPGPSARRESADRRRTRRSLSGPLLLFALFGAFYTIPPQGSDRVPHLSGIIEAGNALREGQFPPRVAPHLAGGTRYPVFQFYGCIPYGLAGALTLLPGVDAYNAWRLVTFLSVTLAGFYTYRTSLVLTRQVWPSVVAGAVFVTAPYLATDFRARFAYPEAVSFCLLPVVLYYSLRAFATPRRGATVAAALAWAAVALTHNITNLYGSILLGSFSLTLLGPDPVKFVRRLSRVAVAYVAAVALSAWYVFPQLAVLDCIVMSTDNAKASPFGSTIWAPLYALLSPVLSIAPSARNSPYLAVEIGWPILAAALLAAVLVLVRLPFLWRRGRETRGLHRPGAWMMARLLAQFALAFFIVWSPVDFWRHLPSLFYNLQITYRILMFVVLWGALLAGMALAELWRRRPGGMPARPAWACVLAASVASMPFQGWHFDLVTRRTVEMLEKAPMFGAAEYQYNPVAANMARYRVEVPPGVAFMPAADVRPLTRPRRKTRVRLPTDHRVVAQLPVLFYPGLLDVRDHDRPLKQFGQIDGYLAVDLAPGPHDLVIRFAGLRWANWLSGLAWLALGAGAVVAAARVVRRKASAIKLPPGTPSRRGRPEFPASAAWVGLLLMVSPPLLAGLSVYRTKKAARRATGRVYPSSEAFPGARAINAFDGDPDSEWVAIPGPSAYLVVVPPAPRTVSRIELEPRQTDMLGGWHNVEVVLYLKGQKVHDQTFDLPDAGRQPLQVLELQKAGEADKIELRFAEPVRTTLSGQGPLPLQACYCGYREIRIR